jgi:hypothetical protein
VAVAGASTRSRAAAAQRETSGRRARASSAPPVAAYDARGGGGAGGAGAPPQAPASDEARGVLEAFYLGRAVARAVSRRASDAALALLAEVGAAAAEQPARLEALQRAVLDEARVEAAQEMGGAAAAAAALALGPGQGVYGGGGGGGGMMGAAGGAGAGAAAGGGGGAESAEDVADELRADVAECRILIRQLRESDAAAAALLDQP